MHAILGLGEGDENFQVRPLGAVVALDVGSYGPQRERRAVVATNDPKQLADKSTGYLVSNLPHPDSDLAIENELATADLSEIVRLYGLKMWVEQSYEQVEHVLWWSDYPAASVVERGEKEAQGILARG
jgi:hypothetical protein